MSRITIMEGNSSDKDNVRVIVVKGEKGDSVSAEWGTISGNLSDQTDLKNAFDSKANTTDIPTKVSDLQNDSQFVTKDANNLTNYYKKDVIDDLEGVVINQNEKIGKKPYYFNSVSDMKLYNLSVGDMVITKGYYSSNDGGAGEYEIVDDDTLVDDGGSIHELNNGLFAKLIIENNTINIKQLGARPQDTSNNKYDIKPYVEKYLDILKTSENGIKLYIPSGIWYSSPLVLDNTNGFDIKGDEQFILHNNRGTIITSFNDNQNTIWTIGNNEDFVSNFILKNILFTSAEYLYDNNDNIFKENSIKNIVDVCLRINVAQFGDTDNLYFQHINGSALALRSCWEINYRKLFFRDINALNNGVMRIETYVKTGGVNASQFENVMFEQVLGDLILVQDHARFQNCVFNNINFEDYNVYRNGVTYTTITDENAGTIEENATHFNLIKLPTTGTQAHNLIINNIQLNNVGTKYSTINEANYVYDRLCTTNGDYNLLQIIINNIDIRGINKDVTLLYSHDNVDQQSSFIINNVYNSTVHKFKFDIDNFTYIRCDKRLYLPSVFTQRLNNNITPCHEIVANRTTGFRYLISDSDCINELGIAVKMYSNAPAFKFTVASNKIYLRAKIPNEETYAIYIGGSHSQNEVLTGTGEFKIYEITLGSQWKVGDAIQINGNNGDVSSMLVDYIIN